MTPDEVAATHEERMIELDRWLAAEGIRMASVDIDRAIDRGDLQMRIEAQRKYDFWQRVMERGRI